MTFLKHLELVGYNERWNSEINLTKVCLKNIVVNLITKNQESQTLLQDMTNKDKIKKYIKGPCYEKHQIIFKNY